MKTRVLIWLCIGLSIGTVFWYYLGEESTQIQKSNSNHGKNNKAHKDVGGNMIHTYEERRMTNTNTDKEKELLAKDENIPINNPKTSPTNTVAQTKQDATVTAAQKVVMTKENKSNNQQTDLPKSTVDANEATSTNNETQQSQESQKTSSDTLTSGTFDSLDMDNILQKYPPLQPAEEMEFPTIDKSEPRIPHIIHQIFSDEFVPEPYSGFIETFITKNPKWQYRLWTYKSGRKLLVDRQPHLVPMFDVLDKYSEKQFDIIKYAVLYEFGGLYADMDMENLRPLDKVTLKYACIIPMAPVEHQALRFQKKARQHHRDALFLFNKFKMTPELNGDVMLCRPKHPFLHFMLDILNTAADYVGTDRDVVSGSDFITKSFWKYNGVTDYYFNISAKSNMSNSPYFHKGDRTEDDIDAVYIPNSQYFSDNIDPEFLYKGNLKRCYKFEKMVNLITMSKHACAEFERRRKVRENRKYTFVVHHWHTSKIYDYKRWISSLEKKHIKSIVPGCIFYE